MTAEHPAFEPPQSDDRRPRDKVCSIAELAQIAEQARSEGKRSVLAHGVFDLLHIGHARHLESARQHGDLLMVTITADHFVNKGPGRPAFPDSMRAEMLAALEVVDWIAINPHPTAESVLHEVRPDVYVKGPDYANSDMDVTGKIDDEREAVERYGGRLLVTDDVVFSSSALINRYLEHQDPEIRDYLDKLRRSERAEEIQELIYSVSDMRVLLVGDTIIDEYNYVEPLGKSPKENMIATLAHGNELFAGGAIAAANHVAGLCAEVEIVTMLGGADSHEDLVRRNLKPNCSLSAFTRPNAPTTKKSRFVDPGHMRKLFEVYHMNDEPLPESLQRELDELVAEKIDKSDIVVVTDFGHSMIGPSTVKLLVEKAGFLAVNAQTNSANTGFNLITRYPRADYICIDGPEARLAVGDKFCDFEDLATRLVPGQIDCRRIALTRGSEGCVTFEAGGEKHHVPALTKSVVDTVGAGDAFFTVTAPLAATGAPMDLIGFIGNLAGALKVGIVGHRRSIDKVTLLKSIAALLK